MCSCAANLNIPSPQSIMMSELPESPWTNIAIDFFGPVLSGEIFLVIVDLYTRFLFIEIMKTTTVEKFIERLEHLFSIFGYPNECKHNKCPPFNSI